LNILAAIGFALSLAAPPAEPAAAMPPPAYFTGGRVYASGAVHFGARPAIDVTNDGPSWGLGATLQLTVRTPW
jgi:hypothetical protein